MTYTTCKKCLSVDVDREKTAAVAVEDGHVTWHTTRCANCGNEARRVTAGYHDGRAPEGFESLKGDEVVERRNRVEQLTGETPWA